LFRRAVPSLVGWALLTGTVWADPPSLGEPAAVNADDKAKAAETECADGCFEFDWKKVPPIRTPARVGNFAIPPSGEGYYSLRDLAIGEYREKPPRFPYAPFALMQPPFYDADFRYLDDPKNTQHDIFDLLHRIHVGDNFLFSTGGHASYRYMQELGSRLSGNDNEYGLFRTRVFGDLWYRDQFRAYVEFISAQSIDQELTPLPIDRNYADFLNLFVDVKIAEIDSKPAYVRLGRQEVLLGSQRLLSSPDWATTRRSFDGVRAFRQGEKFDVDVFYLSPVKVSRNQLDSHDNNQNFAGSWFTYRPEKGTFLDFYYLFLDNTNKSTPSVGAAAFPLAVAPYNVHTIASRYSGDKNNFLWDVEAMLQLGERGASDTLAGAATIGGGYNFKCAPMNPTVWIYYDYASGDRSPNANDYNTFNQLFPFGHYYFGFLDLVGRQNIQDLNLHLYLYPTKWITFNTQFHHFRLDSAHDALYSAGGVPLRIDPTGTSSKDVGNELDFTLNFHLGAHSDVLIGWSKLWAGEFIRNTGSDRDPELLYLMYNFRW
jgi:hypothetical protein